MKLSDTQRAILTAAAQHPKHLALPPERLPAGALQKVAQALLKNDLVIAVSARAYNAADAWQVDGVPHLLKITDDGLRAIGIDPNADAAPEEDEQSPAAIARRNAERLAAEQAAPQRDVYADGQGAEAEAWGADNDGEPDAPAATAPRTSLRDAATALLAAWDDEANRESDMIGALAGRMETLRAALAGRATTRATGAPRKPREGTKQDAVLALLRRDEGATVAQISEATGWAAHTVRGFFAGLKKKGIPVEAIERVRMVGPNKEGARGSYTVYQVKPD